MAIPVCRDEVEHALRPRLGTLFLYSNPLCAAVAEKLGGYAPYRQTLEELRNELESFLVREISRYTRGSMTVLRDNYSSGRLNLEDIEMMTDDLMGIVFSKLTPFSANFIKINDYSLHVRSLAAMRVLYERYAAFYTPEQFEFMVRMIRANFPAELYESWLKD